MQFLLATLVVVQTVSANLGVTTESQLIKTVVNDTESSPPKPCLRAEFTASVRVVVTSFKLFLSQVRRGRSGQD